MLVPALAAVALATYVGWETDVGHDAAGDVSVPVSRHARSQCREGAGATV